jgi:hypothetical protein
MEHYSGDVTYVPAEKRSAHSPTKQSPKQSPKRTLTIDSSTSSLNANSGRSNEFTFLTPTQQRMYNDQVGSSIVVCIAIGLCFFIDRMLLLPTIIYLSFAMSNHLPFVSLRVFLSISPDADAAAQENYTQRVATAAARVEPRRDGSGSCKRGNVIADAEPRCRGSGKCTCDDACGGVSR